MVSGLYILKKVLAESHYIFSTDTVDSFLVCDYGFCHNVGLDKNDAEKPTGVSPQYDFFINLQKYSQKAMIFERIFIPLQPFFTLRI